MLKMEQYDQWRLCSRNVEIKLRPR